MHHRCRFANGGHDTWITRSTSLWITKTERAGITTTPFKRSMQPVMLLPGRVSWSDSGRTVSFPAPSSLSMAVTAWMNWNRYSPGRRDPERVGFCIWTGTNTDPLANLKFPQVSPSKKAAFLPKKYCAACLPDTPSPFARNLPFYRLAACVVPESRCTPYNAYTAAYKAIARRYYSSGNAGICTHVVPRFLPVGRRRRRVNNACKGQVQIHLWTPPTRDPSGIFAPLPPVSAKACTPLNRGGYTASGQPIRSGRVARSVFHF